jgi:hypothetical protein
MYDEMEERLDQGRKEEVRKEVKEWVECALKTRSGL